MKEIEITAFAEFHNIIENHDARSVVYRGVKSANYPLIPKIGRIIPPVFMTSKEQNEREILRLFKERAFPYLDFTPASDWDWLAIGQQYGLPTRLLDWTANPLVACFFAVEEVINDDSVIYTYHNEDYISVEEYPDPFRYDKVGKFVPQHLIPRITTQGGLFTIHPDPYKVFESNDIEKIIIPNKARPAIKKTLNKYGVDRFALFPGLDGLAAYIEWSQSKND